MEKLDQYILKSADYDKYEKLFLKAQEECPERFYEWLGDKGVEEYQETFAYLSDVYITFICGYSHEEPVTLKSGPGKYFVELYVIKLFSVFCKEEQRRELFRPVKNALRQRALKKHH